MGPRGHGSLFCNEHEAAVLNPLFVGKLWPLGAKCLPMWTGKLFGHPPNFMVLLAAALGVWYLLHDIQVGQLGHSAGGSSVTCGGSGFARRMYHPGCYPIQLAPLTIAT